MSKNLTREFASALHLWPADEPEVIEIARLLLLDGLSIALAGSQERGPGIIAKRARADAAGSEASVLGHDFKTSAAAAARINGTSMHVLDYEPMWSPSNHGLSTTLPALLAVAEQLERTGSGPQGRQVLRALAKGIEAQGRIRVASNQLEAETLTFHPPGVVGPIEAAVAVADLIGLELDPMVAAIGIAASCASGLLANSGSMTKALHCGNAAMNGLEAAFLARDGFTADIDAIGHAKGYGQAFYGASFESSALVGDVRVPRILKPGPAWKLFPSQYGTHFVITAALQCRDAINDPQAIQSVMIKTPVYRYLDRQYPRSGLDGKFSFQYCAAMALLDGTVTPSSFTDAIRFSPRTEAMLDRIAVLPDPKIGGSFEKMSVEVVVTLRDGTSVERKCNAPDGSWSRPVAPERLERKARDLALPHLGERRFDAMMTIVQDDPSRISITQLMSLLGAPER